MAADNLYWNRIGYVAIEDDNGDMIKYGDKDAALDFKFSGEYIGDVFTTFTVSILGLSMDSVNKLTVWNPMLAWTKRRKIQVFAGYESTGLGMPLFEGIIIEATPTNPPEMWLNMKCINIPAKATPVQNCKFVFGTPRELFFVVAEALGMKAQWDWEKDPQNVIRFLIEGSRLALPGKLARVIGAAILVRGDTLVAIDPGIAKEKPSSAFLCDSEHGMLGITHVDVAGAKIRMRFNPTLSLGRWIKLTSALLPQANGYYRIIKQTLTGHLRGDEWHTDIECIRKID